MLLQDMIKGAMALEAMEKRDPILQRASTLYRELGDIDKAQELAAKITVPSLRDTTRYLNVIEEIASGRIGTAMKAVEALSPPFYRARALGMLGLAQERDRTYRDLAEGSFTRARELTASLSHPVEQLAVSSELARFYTHAGQDAAAHAEFSSAIRLLEQLPQTTDQDLPLAILATNQARALKLADAHLQLTNIRDLQIALGTSERLSDSELLAKGMNE